MNKSALAAFFLGLIPGIGHIYWGHKVRGVLYTLAFIGALALGFFTVIVGFNHSILLVAFAALIWGINMLDITITLLLSKTDPNTKKVSKDEDASMEVSNERVTTMLLSIIPGMGHFYLGLSYRGLTLLAAFFGIIIMVFFVSFLTSAVFLIFLLALPIIWIYCMFDIIQLLNQKQSGKELEDKTIMDDFNRARDNERKSKMTATILSIFPGAGHLYLGLQKRGIQLMASFLFSIYILDVLNLSLFLFLIPLIWFFSFFDALQLANRFEYEVLEDVPIIKYLANYQKWIGFGLILLGLFYLFDSVLMPVFAGQFETYFNINIWQFYHQYFQVSIICLLLIGGGIGLAVNHKKTKNATED
ncbi:hypothetical protein SAMN04487943_104391 [Gracilibacillus orientalis]|uniref:TM2 domain-containing protein n=1 Tax=Gracilibacillus orientalis TaxID=334253 RepID=A0A1I4L6E8_9BACI|nr:hypothetical protein [Gracilibacillus orientalis]SFL86552.1 hypothetical protein SAMN04487943_104391 [Gracilibacillus orientalis]